MTKYPLKLVEYILPSSKDWTRVRFLSYRDFYLHSASISRENIVDIVLSRISTKITDTTKTYCKRATSDEGILGICKETRRRLLSLLIVGDSREHVCISNSQRNVLVLYISSWVALRHQERRVIFPPEWLQKQSQKWRPKQKLDVYRKSK